MNDHDATQRFLDSLPEIAPDQEFAFACHPDVPCFNACCSDLNLMLTPYDVLRLRRTLGESSAEFLQNRTEMRLTPDTGLPLCKLRMCDDKRRSCPFVREAGCSVYQDRPGACRTYPLGRATRVEEGGGVRERFFLVREPHCRGFAETSTWTPGTWLKDQGLEPYNELNDRYMQLLARIRDTGRPVDPRRANMAALALYQLDNFARFMQDTGLLERLELDAGRKERILEDEETRLRFAVDWLELVLFGETAGLRPKA
ncbi:YkgJ family cysteine cluster protein [Desulfocurvus sp. DL9XJH121]